MAPSVGKFLIIIGIAVIAIGIVLNRNFQIPWLGQLPGDIFIKKENFTFYFPLMTSLLLSLVLSVLFMLWSRR